MNIPGRLRTDADGHAAGGAPNHGEDIEYLKRRVERLKLYSAALTLILMEKLGVTQAEIDKAVDMIDGMDGIKDGTMRRMVVNCPRCGKVVNQKADKCMYCGNDALEVPFLERI
ncbi:MAG: hypothetical protein L6R48_03885 [Planctomycetes bacterium]|nr:hypothetical protein [Planctomycetota bacterium]